MIMLPEIIVALTAFAVIGLELTLPAAHKRCLSRFAMLGLAAAFFAVVFSFDDAADSPMLFGGQFVLDPVAAWFKLMLVLAGGLSIAVAVDHLDGKIFRQSDDHTRDLPNPGEFLALILFNLVGMMLLSSARDLVTLYVSLELATIPLYMLVAWRKRSLLSIESAMKYIILGAVSSGVLLFGLGILYGLSGTMNLAGIASALDTSAPALWLAVAMITAGVGFKLTLVPFHLWAAEVYHGAAAPVTAYLSVASKCAGLAFMFQLFYRVLGGAISDLGPMIALVAAATMTLGNTAAIVQNNIKRFMAFSSISQAGYLLMGFLSTSEDAVPSILFYMLVYILSNMAVFAVIIFYLNGTGRERIEDYRGLSRTNPVVALAMMLALFSLAGIPPLSGFTGKFFLFSVAAQEGYYWLVGLASVNSTVSLYYYLRIVRQMYIEPLPESESNAAPIQMSPILKVTLAVTTLSIVTMGVVPVFYNTIREQTSQWIVAVLGG